MTVVQFWPLASCTLTVQFSHDFTYEVHVFTSVALL